uniref:Uncharacterized protein n=1 Tax=viral metagenome TaxID=1070528 RepID=A0A6C0JYF8_9ZZZZ
MYRLDSGILVPAGDNPYASLSDDYVPIVTNPVPSEKKEEPSKKSKKRKRKH